MSSVSEIVGLEFEDPAGDRLRFEWLADELESFEPDPHAEQPVWRLGGELDWDEIEVFRVISARLGDGRLLALVGLRPPGAQGHDDELVVSALGTTESFDQMQETLLSTEYDGDGRPRRIGLELYPSEDSIPIRVAGEASDYGFFDTNGVRRTCAALRLRSAGASRRRRARRAARDVRRSPIKAVISDFGGVLTTPLMNSFAAFQDRTGISPESLGRGDADDRRARRQSPPVRAGDRPDHRGPLPQRRRGGARAGARPPARDAQLQGDLLRGAGAERADDLPHARDPARTGHRMALLTNNVREWEHLWRSMLPVDEIFELVIDSGFVGMRKPDPGIYELTVARLSGINPDDCLFVDDLLGERRSGAGDRDGRRPLPRQRAGDR